MYCKNCGRRLEEDENFCKNCGEAQNSKVPIVGTATPLPNINAERAVEIGSLAASVLTVILLFVNWVDITYLSWYGEKSKFSALGLYFGIKSLGENTIIDYGSVEYTSLKFIFLLLSLAAVVSTVLLVVATVKMFSGIKTPELIRKKYGSDFFNNDSRTSFLWGMSIAGIMAVVFLISIEVFNESLFGEEIFNTSKIPIIVLILSLVFVIGVPVLRNKTESYRYLLSKASADTQKYTAVCSKCGKEYDGSVYSCPNCGKIKDENTVLKPRSISALAGAKRSCSNCGYKYDAGMKSCPSCGKR